MHNIAKNYTQEYNYQKKILSTYSLIKKKYTTNTHIPFFLEEGGILYYKKKKKLNHNLTKITKKMQSTFMFKTDNKYKHSCLNHKDGPVF